MSRNLKTALFSTLLLLLISYPILGLKLSVIGIGLQVEAPMRAPCGPSAWPPWRCSPGSCCVTVCRARVAWRP